MIERIAQLRAEGEASIAAAGSHRRARGAAGPPPGPQGRAPQLLRGVAELPPEERGAVGRPPTRRAARWRTLIAARAAELDAAELDVRLASGPRRRHAARRAAPRRSAAAPAHDHAARDRGHLRRPGLPGRRRGPRSRPSTTTSTRSTTPRRTRRGCVPTPSTSPTRSCCGCTPRRCRSGRWRPAAADLRHLPGPRLPARQRRHPLPAVPPGGGPGGRRGHHAGRPQGHAAVLRPPDVRRRARRAPAPALLPVHRAQRRGRRLLLQLPRRVAARRLALPAVQGHGLDRDPGLGDGRPGRLRLRAQPGLRPRAGPGLGLRDGHRPHRDAQARRARPAACSSRTTCASWGSSR